MNNRDGSRHLRFALRLLAAVAFLISAGSCSNWVLGIVQSFGSPNGGKISTFAGNGTGSYSGDGGGATSAELDGPQGVAIDSSGNLYIADSGNSVVRKVTNGNISTYAGDFTLGNGYSGDTGPANAAKLNYPYGIAVDATGNLYIADTFNNRIREVTASNGNIATVAGNGTQGFTLNSGSPLTSELNSPYAVAFDSANNRLYIDDYGNNRILMVFGGTITVAAGNGNAGYYGDGGQATSARLNYPWGIAVDSVGNLFIADSYNNVIRKVTTNGIISTVAGSTGSGYSGDGGAATSASLHFPTAVAVDTAGNVYAADQLNNVVRKVDTSGNITTVAGNFHLGAGYGGDGNVATAALLNEPWGIAIDASGNLYIADSKNQRIRVVGR